ncbi:MAG: tetratricopeptide repeat protein [bacterium]|nr:tetratricopeptide repeat protein [bacterium]
MKKVEQVEVEYIRKSTALIIAVVCLAAGFLMGMFYKSFDAENTGKVSRVTVAPQPVQPAQSPETMNQKAAEVLKLKQMVAANPKSAEAWALLGHAYFDMDQYTNAIDAYKKHLELNPNNADTWTDLGVMYRRSGNPTEAIRCFDKSIAINPRHQQSRFNKGVVLMHDLNNLDAALQSWRELVKMNPSAKAPTGQPVKDLIDKFAGGAK